MNTARHRRQVSLLSLALLCGLWRASLVAADWPQFRGPGGQGHADAGPAPLDWSETEHVRWKVPVPGTGWSSPVIADGRVWLTTATAERPGVRGGPISLRLLAFEAASGREVVNVEVFALRRAPSINFKNSLASPTPVISGDRVFVHFGAEGTAAVSTAGRILWTTRIAYSSQHGSGGSPIVYGDLLIFSADGPESASLIALDTGTGRTRWRTPRRRPFDQAYSTPLLVSSDSGDLIVSPGANYAAAYEADNGREAWYVEYPGGFSNVPRPVFAHGLVVLATGFNDPTLMAVRLGGHGNVTTSHVAWTIRRGAPLTPSPIVVGDLLYFVSDAGIATCVDLASGRTRWQQRLGGNYSASPVFAGGRLYFLNEEGTASVVAPGPQFQRLATNRVDGSTLASIGVADGAFFVRTDAHLYRIEP